MLGALLLLAVAVWLVALGLEMSRTDLPAKVIWTYVEYIGVVGVPAFWAVFVLQYTGRQEWLARMKDENKMRGGFDRLNPRVSIRTGRCGDRRRRCFEDRNLRQPGQVSEQ